MAEKKNSDTPALNGVYDAYDRYLKVYKQAKFENGMLHGIYREYFDEGKKQLKIEGRFENGMKQGVWSEYDKKGRIESVKIWNRGELLERTMYDDEVESD